MVFCFSSIRARKPQVRITRGSVHGLNTLITPGWAVTVVGRPLFTILLVLAVSVFAGYQARTITLGSVTDGLLVERGPRPDRSQFPKPANLILAIEAPTHVFDAGFLTLLANTSGKIAQLELVEQVSHP